MCDLGIIDDGAVLFENGKITAVGPPMNSDTHTGERRRRTRLPGKLILPGFVDSHTHPVFAAPRLIDFEKRIAGASYEEIAAAGGGIRASIRGVRESSVEQLDPHVLQCVEGNGAHGTTTVEAKSGYGLDFDSEIKSLEAIREAAHEWPGTVVPTFLGAHVVPPEYRDNPDEYVRIVCEEMIPAVGSPRFARSPR